MVLSVPMVAVISSLHVIAFVFAVGAERRRNTGKVLPDEYDDRIYCSYRSDASTVYGLSAFAALLVAQAALSGATRCVCFGRGVGVGGGPRGCAVCSFVFSWLSFFAAEACLLAGSAKNAYHTKYLGHFATNDLTSCAMLRKGVFGAAAALVLITMAASLVLYWSHSKSGAGGWVRHRNEGVVGMTDRGPDSGEHGTSKA